MDCLRGYMEDFNPRLREGGDAFHSLFIPANVISIHASAKEATRTILGIVRPIRFQSTPPRRRRQAFLIVDWLARLYFNPRLREGGDKEEEKCTKKF